MDISSKKLELLDWLMNIKDNKLLMQVEKLKEQVSPNSNEQPVFGRLKGKIKLLPGFDSPLSDFKDYEK